jgi:hypothetical protein
MICSRRLPRLASAAVIGLATTVLPAGAVFAHPESEGTHVGTCIVTVEPGSVAVGGQFTVAGNFGMASIFLLEGDLEGPASQPAEDAQPDAATPEGASFSVTFTAEAADVGDWTVVGLIPGSECGDADHVTVTAAVPNTAVPAPSTTATLGWLMLGLGLALGICRVAGSSRRAGRRGLQHRSFESNARHAGQADRQCRNLRRGLIHHSARH